VSGACEAVQVGLTHWGAGMAFRVKARGRGSCMLFGWLEPHAFWHAAAH
jgi:hypothetical protein